MRQQLLSAMSVRAAVHRRSQTVLVLVVLAGLIMTLVPRSAAAGEEPKQDLVAKVAKLEREISHLRRKLQWMELERGLRATAPRRAGSNDPGIVVIELSLNFSEDEHRLSQISPPRGSSRSDVRRYVSEVLQVVRGRSTNHNAHPVVSFLSRVRAAHADVLIEPLIYFPNRSENLYLRLALENILGDHQKSLVVGWLSECPDLISIVLARGWVRGAREQILDELRGRSPTMDADWITAAAQVVTAEDVGDLRWQLRHGAHPRRTWIALQGVLGKMDLATMVNSTWRSVKGDQSIRPTSSRYLRHALIAAHYGHLDGLGAVVQAISRGASTVYWHAFKAITPYPEDRPAGVGAWFEEHRGQLSFNSKLDRYVLRDR